MPDDHGRAVEHAILVTLFALLLFASPMMGLWAVAGGPWYLPYALWALVIGLGAWLQFKHRGRDEL